MEVPESFSDEIFGEITTIQLFLEETGKKFLKVLFHRLFIASECFSRAVVSNLVEAAISF